MRKIKYILFVAFAIVGLSTAPLSVSHATVGINDAKEVTGKEACKVQGNKASCDSSNSLPNIIRTVTNILLFLVGAVAVIMLIIGGFRYVVSNGEAANIKTAKDTILYAIIGIVVAFLAYAAVNFVIDNLMTGSKTAVDCTHMSSQEKEKIKKSKDKKCST